MSNPGAARNTSRPPLPVKVCGITRLADGQAALDAGAAALGFIFYSPSPRYIQPEMAARIVEALAPEVVKVGVFVGAEADEINRIAETCSLTWVQLHGGEPAELIAQLERPAYRAFRLKEQSDVAQIRESEDQLLLLDTYDPDHYGGTGKPFDWNWVIDLARERRVILAGGVSPENAARAVNMVAPVALDVSSGVETAPGIKDRDKLNRLFDELREAGFSGHSPWSLEHASGSKT